ncbi:MAG: hypothetical protein FD136_1852 [Chitinophagaceae bacterium]|nr:MAG: hypothetical protein FD136_1852 [Chitinophagaceae bacterium]
MEEKNSVSINELPSYSESLALDWTLSADEIQFILNSAKGDNPILNFAIQLKSLQNSGVFHDYDNEDVLPEKITQYLAKQLSIEIISLTPISKNSQTTYHKKIQTYLNYQDFSDKQEAFLKKYIMHEMKTDLYSESVLIEKARDFLKTHKIMRPAVTVFDRLIASIHKESMHLLYDNLANKLTPDKKEKILLMLKRQPHLLSQANYYKKSPPEPSQLKINTFIKRFNELKEAGITEIEFSDITESIFDKLELLGRTYDASALSHISPENKKIALLLCTLSSASKNILDHILDMNSKLLAKKERISQNFYEKTLKKLNSQAKKGLKFIIKTTKQWRYHADPKNTTLFDFIETVDDKALDDSIAACEAMSTYQTSGFYQILENKYNDLRKYTTHLFELEFKGAAGTESILKSIHILKKLNDEKSNTLPSDAPTDFIPKMWKQAICNDTDGVSRRTWEMALYYAIKNNIEKGDIYLNHSKKHRYFWNTVYSESAWEKEKPLAFKSLGFPEKFDELLAVLKKEYFAGITLSKNGLKEKSFFHLDQNGKLKLKRDDALEIPESVKTLKKLIEARMPPVRIEKMLSDIEEAHYFSRFFLPPEGFDKKFAINKEMLHMGLVAQGTNLGFDDMSKSTLSATSLEELKHTAQWCIRPDSVTKTNNFFVEKHAEHPLAQLHGDFSRSSSDAERFCIQKSTDLASFYPKAFGYYQKVIAIYTHMSDQFSVFSTQVISCGVREASYVLDGLLNNLMITSPHFHCTDTGGFTHQLFALCYLLGFSFQPRLKDLAVQTLYKFNRNDHYGEIDSMFGGHIDIDCIAEQWEQLIRIVVSLKNHVAPAHLILQKLAARGSSDRVAKAIMGLGKLIKTIYILYYLSDESLRRKVQLQLNRGETRHYLARHIFFANQGEFKTADYEEMMSIASCLSLLSNAVLLWNTPRIYNIVAELRASGIHVDDEDLKKVSLLLFKHLIVHGTYDFRAANMPVVDYASNLKEDA